MSRPLPGWHTLLLAALTPLMEKNVLKTMSPDVPLVFSMTRVIVLAFSAAMLRQIWHFGVDGWPAATLAIAIVLAMPVLTTLEHAKPAQVLELARTLVGRFGIGAVRRVPYEYSTEPSKYDDHRDDA